MSFFQAISELFENIFKRSSPEVQKKQNLRKMDSELRSFSPAIYKEGELLPNFAEGLYILYKMVKPLDDLFYATINPNDAQKRHRFEAQLIMTGYTSEYQALFESLSYENRKMEILSETSNVERVYIHQRKQLENLLKELNSDDFKMMDRDIVELRHFAEFCRYNFVQFLQLFDSNFVPADYSYKPRYVNVSVSKAVNLLEDLYYQMEGLKVTTVIADQVKALAQLKKGELLSDEDSALYVGNLKKINYVLSKVIPADRIKALIRYAREDALYEPKVEQRSGTPRQEFADLIQSRFEAEEQRIKSEIQAEQVSTEVAMLFKDMPLEPLYGYDTEANKVLQENTSLSFKWILPLKILKTFLKVYVSDGIKGLLNDLVIEGFFSNPAYKSNFSSVVYSVINAEDTLKDFEVSFGSDQPNSIAVMQGYIKDSSKDKDFYKRLEKMVGNANNQGHTVLQNITASLHSLHKILGELLADSKKPSSEIISNVKVLMMSSRNRDNTNLMEEQHPSWNTFFAIMKNYVIITNSEM